MVAVLATGKVQVVYYSLSKAGNRHYLKGRVAHCGSTEFLAMVQDISKSEYEQALKNSQ